MLALYRGAVGAGGRGASPGVPGVPSSAVAEASLSRRRYYDLAYVLIVLLAFPLYWSKIMDWRLCQATADSVERDPWLLRPPSPAWIKSWPCGGSQASKLGYIVSSPAPFLRSLAWPICFSELHFFTSLYAVVVGGLVMLAVTRGSKYGVTNKWRLRWAFIARVQVRAAPILVKLLRPQTPWPVAISQSLPLEGPASVLYNVALMGPVSHQAMGAVMDVLFVSMICRMYGSDWPHAMPPLVLVLQQAACGLLAVGISAFLAPSCPTAGVGQLPDSPKSPKAGVELHGASGHQASSGEEAKRKGRPHGAPEQAAPAWEQQAATPETLGVTQELQAAPPKDAGTAAASDAPSCGGKEGLLRLCRRLAVAGASAASGPDRPRRSSSSSCSGDGSGKVSASSDALDANATGGARCSSRISGGWGPCGGEYNGGVLAWTHVQMKVTGMEPSDLPPEAEDRVTEALARSCPGAAGAGVAIRSGCIELHLDLVRGVGAAPPAVTVSSASAGSAGAAAGQAAPEPLDVGSQHAPASAEQQGLASCILQALGLPPGYDAAVRAQVGAHLLTLTPAAGSGFGWAVLGTRRMQAHEVPWVSQVEPPAVVAPAAPLQAPAASAAAPAADAADGAAGQHTAAAPAAVVLRMTISGSAEGLAVAHEDANLELLALFEGAFLKLSDLKWGPLDGSLFAAGGGGDAAAAAVDGACIARLPPSLMLCRRVLTARLALPAGRTGTVSLLLMHRGTAGQSHSLLLVRPEDAVIAAEVVALQARAQSTAAAAGSPATISVSNFIRDLGHWLQYREFWRRKATAASRLAAAAAAASGGGASISARLAGRLSSSWMSALMTWSRRRAEVGVVSGGGIGGLRLQLKPKRMTSAAAREPAPGHGNGVPTAVAHVHLQSDDSDLLDQDEPGGCNGRRTAHLGGDGGLAPQARHFPYAPANGHAPAAGSYGGGAAATAAPAMEEQQRLAQGSLPAFGQRAYQTHMATARRVLLEFALERRCTAVAAALLEPAPVPPASLPAAAAAAGAAAYGAASYLADLAESSRAASPDGLTLLHRAVRSGDAAIVQVVLRAAARAAEAAAAAAAAAAFAAAAAPPRQPSHPHAASILPTPSLNVACSLHGQNHAPAAEVADAAEARHGRFVLYDWGTPDLYGITPLHYLAVLDDGGALARHVLGTQPEALALWDVAGPGMPSPASFAAQNGLTIDTEALRRESKLGRAKNSGGGGGGDGPAKAEHKTRPLFLAALWGFPCGDVEKRYQRFARTRAQSGGLPTWLLLLHLMACTGGMVQALAQPRGCCRRGMLLVLQAGSFLLALLCYRPAGQGRGRLLRVAAWAMQALALAVLLSKTLSSLPGPWDLGCTGGLGALYDEVAIGGGRGGGGGDGPQCASAALHHGLLALHHVLAVATVPYTVPYALLRLLAVQIVEVAACALLFCAGFAAPDARMAGLELASSGGVALGGICSGETPAGGEPGAALAWAGGAAAHVAGGSLLRGIMSSLLLLMADLRTRAAFVCSHSGGGHH